jgi:phosphotransferase system  glucose/maltose/N-acetylglucosamine-specific IIC component
MEQSVIMFWICFAILSLIFSIVCGIALYKDNHTSAIMIIAIFFFLNVILSFAYPQFTLEYKEGYNDYPDDILYDQAKIIAADSSAINPVVWYCDGWEKAQKEEAKLTFEELKHNISREVTN